MISSPEDSTSCPEKTSRLVLFSNFYISILCYCAGFFVVVFVVVGFFCCFFLS